MATLVNGNGNPAVYAQQDADLLTGALGASTRILNIGSKMVYTIEDANTIAVADGVILTKEGRRIQVDVGNVDEFVIPTGAAGVTRYYIIGYHLYTDGSANQLCETFVQLMENGSETITENTFRNGASEVYVSLYRVKQIGLNLDTITALLPVGIALTDMTDIIGDTNISGIGDGTLTGGLYTINQNLTEKIEQKSGSLSDGTDTYTGINLDFISYDATAKKILLHEKGTGADAVIPFSGKPDGIVIPPDACMIVVGGYPYNGMSAYLKIPENRNATSTELTNAGYKGISNGSNGWNVSFYAGTTVVGVRDTNSSVVFINQKLDTDTTFFAGGYNSSTPGIRSGGTFICFKEQ